jgi:hypothetical protein
VPSGGVTDVSADVHIVVGCPLPIIDRTRARKPSLLFAGFAVRARFLHINATYLHFASSDIAP